MNDARLIKIIPKRRLRLISGDASKPPAVGDFGETDHCYSGFWGAMVLVYFLSADGSTEWEANAYESEIERMEGTNAQQARLTESQYIESLAASPWRFPDVNGFADVPPDWAVAAWDVDAVRSPIMYELCRGVNKNGTLCLYDTQLVRMSELLRSDQVVALYEALRDGSPHRESEFRGEFERIFAKHVSRLPPVLTRDQIVKRLGVDEATAAELLGEG